MFLHTYVYEPLLPPLQRSLRYIYHRVSFLLLYLRVSFFRRLRSSTLTTFGSVTSPPHILLQFLHFSPFRFMLVIHHSSVANAGAQYANWMHLSYRYKRHSISFESSLPLTIDISSSNISNHSSLITSNSDEMLIYD